MGALPSQHEPAVLVRVGQVARNEITERVESRILEEYCSSACVGVRFPTGYLTSLYLSTYHVPTCRLLVPPPYMISSYISSSSSPPFLILLPPSLTHLTLARVRLSVVAAQSTPFNAGPSISVSCFHVTAPPSPDSTSGGIWHHLRSTSIYDMSRFVRASQRGEIAL